MSLSIRRTTTETPCQNIFLRTSGGCLAYKLFASTAECLAYYSTGAIAAPIGNRLGTATGRIVGVITGVTLGTLCTGLAIHATCTKTPHLSPALCSLSFFAILTTACFLHTHYIEHLETTGSRLGGAFGEFSAYVGAGILGAFAAIKLLGSQEFLWNRADPFHSYLLKTCQSVLICSFAETCGFLPQNPMMSSITSLILGSIAYNALALYELSQRIYTGSR